MKKIFSFLFLIVLIAGVIAIELLPPNAPEIVYIRVLKADKTPEENADCKADIITPKETIEDRPLERVEDMDLDCYTEKCINDKDYNKGFYMLDTGLRNYLGKFEIRIVCTTKKAVSYTILNNKNIPCEIKNNGKEVRCLSY